jgi:hypothetical protein
MNNKCKDYSQQYEMCKTCKNKKCCKTNEKFAYKEKKQDFIYWLEARMLYFDKEVKEQFDVIIKRAKKSL